MKKRFGRRFKLVRDLPDVDKGAVFVVASDDHDQPYLFLSSPGPKIYLNAIKNFHYWFEPADERERVV